VRGVTRGDGYPRCPVDALLTRLSEKWIGSLCVDLTESGEALCIARARADAIVGLKEEFLGSGAFEYRRLVDLACIGVWPRGRRGRVGILADEDASKYGLMASRAILAASGSSERIRAYSISGFREASTTLRWDFFARLYSCHGPIYMAVFDLPRFSY
jgi:hypothetical protein